MNDLARLLEAAAFAAEKHTNQRRKDAEASPYINHPLALAHLLATTGGVTEVVVLQAALLHDTLEDTETTHAEMVERFGEAVASSRENGSGSGFWCLARATALTGLVTTVLSATASSIAFRRTYT